MKGTLFDLREVPFSRAGSYLAFSILPDAPDRPGGLFLRTVRAGAGPAGALFRVGLLRDGSPVPFVTRADAATLVLDDGTGEVAICMPDARTIRFRGKGAGLRLAIDPGSFDFDCAVRRGGDRWRLTSFTHRLACDAWPLTGSLSVDAPWQGDRCAYVNLDFLPEGPSVAMEGVLAEADDDRAPPWRDGPSFEDECRRVRDEVDAWRAGLGDEGGLAGYVMWSAIVAPEGHFARPAMLMSKNWMCQVWSWDHCFNALALAPGHPALCWDQFMVLFDHQRGDGRLPDSIGDRLVRWDFAKPPIHGWALAKLMAHPGLVDEARLREAYGPLCRWTRWWMDCRDDDADGLPQYEHGNDSGWDNGTTFLSGVPVESPDLAAFLVLQMETLAEVARRLGKADESREWRSAAGELLSRMLERFWRGDRFVGHRGEHHDIVDTDSLLPLMPLVLGRRLPAAMASALVGRLRQRFLTPYGLATECPDSPQYRSDGYWRGPIWAPSTVLVVDGLFDLGEDELARDICRRFVAMTEKSGMAENFDALTGQGLRDRAYTWTASGCLLLRRRAHT